MTSLFCRHNRLTSKCPICSRELDAELKAKAPSRPARPRARGAAGATASRRSPGVVTRRVARAAAERLEPPGPHPAVAEEPELEEALWLAFLLSLVDPAATELHAAIVAGRPGWASGELPDIPGADPRTVPAYRAWVERSGSQAQAFLGEPGWSPERRFGRVFERLALPGLGRTARYELLNTLAAAGRCPFEADGLHFGKEDDATTVAAKRLLVSGDRMLLERRE